MGGRLTSWMPVAIWSLFVAVLLLAPGGLGGGGVSWLSRVAAAGGDKVVHAALFFIHAALASRLLARPDGRWLAAAFAIGYGLLLELLQQGIPGRGLEAADVVANSAGALGWALLPWLSSRRR